MNAPKVAALLVRHSSRLRIATVALALALVSQGACANPLSHSADGHACADKVAQSLTTNTPVGGLWKCLSPAFQSTLQSLGYATGDRVFSDPTAGKPPVLATHFVGASNGVDLYAVIVQRSGGGVVTLVLVVWADPKGLVTDFYIAAPQAS